MAESKLDKKVPAQRKIVCKGPKDKDSGAVALRIQTEKKKDETMDIYEGQTLIVGRDIPEDTADNLLQMDSWKFEEVK